MAPSDRGKTWIAWGAGLIDGEATIYMEPKFGITLKIAMTHKPTLDRLVEILGGWVRKGCMSRTNKKQVWVWNIRSQGEIRRILGLVRPWLVTKAAEADEMLGYLGRVERGKINRADRQAVYWRLRELKRG